MNSKHAPSTTMSDRHARRSALRPWLWPLFLVAAALTVPSLATAACPDISVQLTLSGPVTGGSRCTSTTYSTTQTISELESITSVSPSPLPYCSGNSGNRAQIDLNVGNANQFRFRRFPNNTTVTFTGPATTCDLEPESGAVAQAPLFLTSSVEPNVLFILDDSGSMLFETVPDELTDSFGESGWANRMIAYVYPQHYTASGYAAAGVSFSDCIYSSGTSTGCDYWRSSSYRGAREHLVPRFNTDNRWAAYFRSYHNNQMYYNPEYVYQPWVNAYETEWADAPPAAAPHNPSLPAKGTRDLTVDNTQRACWIRHTASEAAINANLCDTETITFWPATYFQYNSGDVLDPTSYTRVEIRPGNTYARSSNRTDCADHTACTYAEEIQNFANWYSYHRSRILAARGGIGRAFAAQDVGMRVGFGAINQTGNTVDNVTTDTLVRGVRPFSGSDRLEFFDLLYDHNIPLAGTPLRRALDDAGQYFSRADNRGPWGAVPGTNDSTPHLECRQNFTILMTDGYWSGDQASTSAARLNVDGTSGPTHTSPSGQSYTYSAVAPFADNHSNTLADVAMYYWKNDLRTLPNRVPTTTQNPAFWQHMVTFGVGLGPSGSIDPADAFAAINSGATIDWPYPNPSAYTSVKMDDLLHAAVNSRGGYFTASDPGTFATELSNVLETIVARIQSSATSAAASSAVLQSDTLLYRAGFRSTDWSGTFKAYEISQLDGSLGGIKWDAENKLRNRTPASRKLFTRHSETGNGVALLALGSLSTAQQAALNRNLANSLDSLGAQRIAWLRGDDNAHASFRSRSLHGELRLLGDIINSNPQYVGNKNYGYDWLPGTEGTSYKTFRASAAYNNRPAVIYTGANDGFLHAFDAATGEELFAYMPSPLLLAEPGKTHAPINRLMDPLYPDNHRYFVDGTAAVGDAYIGGAWKTVLVGTMGAGGRTVFALDITDPANFGASNVLWEYTHNDLGYNVGQPEILRMRNGEWAAVFGNGYGGSSNQAHLFIVNLSTGLPIAKIDTGDGSAATPNGLGPTTSTDWSNGDLITNYIFAGDLRGNLWRFDVSGNVNTWDNAPNRKILFTARDPSNVRQPINSAPWLALKPDAPSTLMVFFGTGSYFRTTDGNSTQVQSLYGVANSNTTITGRSELLQQTITWQGEHTFGEGTSAITYRLREVSNNQPDPNNPKKGWYLDLIYNNTAQGERVISPPTPPSGPVQNRVRFTSLVPDNDPCGSGRAGWVMDIDLLTGGRTTESVFDFNQDGQFDASDLAGGRTISGIGGTQGESLTVIRSATGSTDHLYGGGSGGLNDFRDGFGSANEAGPTGRQSWRQFR